MKKIKTLADSLATIVVAGNKDKNLHEKLAEENTKSLVDSSAITAVAGNKMKNWLKKNLISSGIFSYHCCCWQ
jgi:hypothetical protein